MALPPRSRDNRRMLPLVVMIAGILLARGAGAAGFDPFDSWRAATRAGLALMFLFTATSHFIPRTRGDLVRMVPPGLPQPGMLVTLTGIAELAGAVGLLIPSLSRAAALGLIVLLAAMFPANVHAARSGLTIAGSAATRISLRLPLQLLWMALLWWSVSL